MSIRWVSFYAFLAILVLILAGFYLWLESVLSKGPNDWGAQTHALHFVQEKFGPGASIDMADYQYRKDTGTYVFKYEAAGNKGKIACHYDRDTGKFDRDGVISNK